MKQKLQVMRVNDEKTRLQALAVIDRVFALEKKWVSDTEAQFPMSSLSDPKTSWFLAIFNGSPAGVLRLLYDPSLPIPPDYSVSLNPGIDLQSLAGMHRWVEIGRFMIVPVFRRHFHIALHLMKNAFREVILRDYTHFITDVYQGETHSPFLFHTRVLGFEKIGTHIFGELNCSCKRIILILDILKAYQRVRNQRSALFDIILGDQRSHLEQKLAQTS